MAIKIEKSTEAEKNKGGRPRQARTRISFLIDDEDLAERRASGKGWQTRLNDDICVVRELKRKGLWDQLVAKHSAK